jgi:hypothetical protein
VEDGWQAGNCLQGWCCSVVVSPPWVGAPEYEFVRKVTNVPFDARKLVMVLGMVASSLLRNVDVGSFSASEKCTNSKFVACRPAFHCVKRRSPACESRHCVIPPFFLARLTCLPHLPCRPSRSRLSVAYFCTCTSNFSTSTPTTAAQFYSNTSPTRGKGKRRTILKASSQVSKKRSSLYEENAANSPLLRLPPEIRNRIWSYVLGGGKRVHITSSLRHAVCVHDESGHQEAKRISGHGMAGSSSTSQSPNYSASPRGSCLSSRC